ncbi:MAG TPA: F0F1 ATP synthase subunit gamma, partial [Clostridium sp.]|nr:F0F1 ATP synthase subunit gamma [Clostridium sp.]
MAGAGLVKIKRRIKSITSTQKITKAMGLIATSKLR